MAMGNQSERSFDLVHLVDAEHVHCFLSVGVYRLNFREISTLA
jgi:hypothetical protein